MLDKIEKIGHGTLIQHGELNKRVYLMKLDERDCPGIIEQINTLARDNNYSKIFCKIPQQFAPYFFANGFLMEAQIPEFYQGTDAAFFVSKFLSSDRLLDIENDSLFQLSTLLESVNGEADKSEKSAKSFRLVKLTENNLEEITSIYREVFESYPFPIFETGYIQKTMQEGVQYFGMETKGKLVALASAEIDAKGLNAEMTDFATLPKYRGSGLSLLLLKTMEKEMKRQGLKTLYTIARLKSIGMNKTFLRRNFTYAGTLIKNTNISGNIESMNVYYKSI
uniref:putative beta-lysine N-acetyltransferase n=1 Tax=uncultured Draconibacterium sp. TaxID=1573823 RepID=UPI003216F8DB